MKYILILAVFCLASCKAPHPIVVNRDAAGRYMNPSCPVCLKDASGIAALYRCSNGHKYQTTFKPPTP